MKDFYQTSIPDEDVPPAPDSQNNDPAGTEATTTQQPSLKIQQHQLDSNPASESS